MTMTTKPQELAAAMLAVVPDGTSPIACLIACNIMACYIIKETCPPACRRDVVEKFVSDFYEIMMEQDDDC
jgi:hypothetical protein